MGNWWENPCISHVIKYTIGWELWKKYGNQFPMFSSLDGFCCLFACYGKLMRKSIHSPCDEIYHRMGIQWEKSNILWKSMRTNFSGSPHTMGFVGFSREQISQAFPIQWILLPFPMLWEIDEKTNVFPILWSIPQEKYLMGKSTYTMKKYGRQIPRLSPFVGVCWLFACYGKLIRKHMYFPRDEVYHRMGIL